MAELRLGPVMAVYADTLGAVLDARGRAMPALALSFFTWRTLIGDQPLMRRWPRR